MVKKTKRKITGRDVADWALFFVCAQGGMIIAVILMGKTHPIYSGVRFLSGLVVSVPIYLFVRRINSGRFLLRPKQGE